MSIECPKCHIENPDNSRYCKECAAQLPLVQAPHTKTFVPPEDKLTAGSTFAGRYLVLEKLGRGGMGEVYKVKDTKLDEEMALKLIKTEIADDKRTISRFRNELKLARKITHKNVCRVFDFHEEEQTPYITMEYIGGESLRDSIQKQGKLAEDKAIDIAQQIGRGLEGAHEIGIVHRDLKPQNIMIDAEGKIKVMDFGIARSLEAKGVTQTGLIIGTPDYMSPEQAEGKEADQRSDIYSLGIILYEMVTGRVPFQGDSALSVAMKHKTEAPADPRELNDRISEELSSVILKCLEKSQEERFQSVGELLTELRNIEEGLPLTVSVKKPRVLEFLLIGAEEVEVERPVFVAREEELSKLDKFLDSALGGKGKVVFVKGEAGSGKTALVQEFARRAQEAHPELIVVGGNCNAHTGIGDPYLPFREVLALLTGEVEGRWKAGSINTEHARRLWHCLPLMAQSLVEKGPELIGTFIEGEELLIRAKTYTVEASDWLRELRKFVEHKSVLPADPTLQQSVLLKQYARTLETLLEKKPVLLILDDLQWVDTGSVNLLTHMVEQIQDKRALIVGLYRPEEVALDRDGERHPLRPIVNECKTKFGDIEVEVGRTGAQDFVNAYLDTEPNLFSHSFRESFLKHTAGHSLFTTEVFRGLKDQGTLVQDDDGRWKEGEIEWGKLPTRVEAVIGERIERMPENLREILKVASIEGESFTGEVLAGVQKADERMMVGLLSGDLDKKYQLVNARGIKHEGGQRLSQYRFRHILFQKYLYNSLDEVERAHLHEDVGNVLEKLYGGQAVEVAAQLARHFYEAGIAEKAFIYMKLAGINSVQKSANNEAVVHFRKALELLKTLPDKPERTGQELALQLPLAMVLMNQRGYSDFEVGEAFTRAETLCKQIGETPQIVLALHGLWAFYFVKAEFETAIDLVEQILRLAPKAEDPTMLLLIGHNDQAANLSMMGEFKDGLKHAEQAIAAYDPQKHYSLIFQIGQDIKGASICWVCFDLWFLGSPDLGRQRMKDALSFAQELGHPYTLSFALFYSALFLRLCRDMEAVKKTVDEGLKLSTEFGFQMWMGVLSVFEGWILVEQGNQKEGLDKVLQGIEAVQATGTCLFMTHHHAILAEAYLKAGKIEEGLAALKKALDDVEQTGERFYEAELFRLKGELLLKQGAKENEAERHFQKAIDVGAKQNARSWELRATVSLARLWQKQGKKDKARKRLSEIYGWFAEGFDTQDLKDAKALLEELS